MAVRHALGVGLLGCALLLRASSGHAWRVEYAQGTARKAAMDGGGNLVAAGELGGSFAVAKLAAGTGAQQWVATLDPGAAVAVAVDGNDDVVAAGIIADFAVVKLDGSTGGELWRFTMPSDGIAIAVTVDAAGDVIAAGRLLAGADQVGYVVKLAGGTGAVVWDELIAYPGKDTVTAAVGLDGSGHVLATGYVYEFPWADVLVLKLDGATGTEMWRHAYDETNENGNALVVAPNGDAIVAGTFDNLASVARYASATGAEVWRGVVPDVGSGISTYEDVALDPMGNVIAVGYDAPGMLVSKFDGTSGAVLWTQPLTRSVDGRGSGVAIDGTGDVYVTGYLEGAATGPDLTVVKLDGATGDTPWRQFLDGREPAPAIERGLDVVLDGAGGVIAAGWMDNPTGAAFAVFRLDALTGAVGPVSGISIKVKDVAADPSARRVLMSARDVSILVPPEGSAGDPTLGGGTLRVVNPVTLEQATLPLPASGWAAVGGARSRGYTYSDTTGANGPCRKVRVQPGRMRATCLGKQGPIPFTLDEPSQGTVGITLTLGTSDPQCAVFDANVRRDQGTTNPGPTGLFQAGFVLPALGDCP